jgi:uncharacterized protein YlxP (DUF503 family)
MIGALKVECIIYDASSLKEKRAVLQRVIDRLKNRYNIAVSETNYQDLWQRTEISIVAVSSNRVIVEKELNSALRMMDSFPEIETTITTYEWY